LQKIPLEDLDVMVNDSAQIADSLRMLEGDRLLATVSSVLRALGREYRCHRHSPFQYIPLGVASLAGGINVNRSCQCIGRGPAARLH
jgi:hypothetical protein